MKKALLIVLAVVLVLILGLMAGLAYLGWFSRVKVAEQTMGPYTMAYESHTGNYSQTGKVFDRLFQRLQADGIATQDGIGIYYDDPRQVPADQLRSDCACVLAPEQVEQVRALGDKYPLKTLERSQSLVAEFPIHGPLSYMLAPMKTYPALEKAAKTRGLKLGTIYEYYAMADKKILVVAPIVPAENGE